MKRYLCLVLLLNNPFFANSVNTTIQGTGTTYVSPNLDNKPTFSIVNEGESFQYYETLEAPGITNYTHIIRTTQIENVTDTTSTFSQ